MATPVTSTILGAGLGAGLMFLLDPVRGRRRRALVRDKVTRAAHKTRDAYGATQRDISNRVTGMASQLHRGDGGVEDARLEARVRAELGRVASHPRAIHVTATNGCVTLSGDVLAAETHQVLGKVRRIRGVSGINDQLRVHADQDIPALQGTSQRPGWWSSWLKSGWSPTARLVAGLGAIASMTAAVAARRS